MLNLKDPLNTLFLISQMHPEFQIYIFKMVFYSRDSINTVNRIKEHRKLERWGNQLSKTQGSYGRIKGKLGFNKAHHELILIKSLAEDFKRDFFAVLNVIGCNKGDEIA